MMETEDTYWTPLKMDEPVVGDYMATGENCYVPTENDLFWVIWQMKKFLNCLSKQHEYTSHYSIYNKF